MARGNKDEGPVEAIGVGWYCRFGWSRRVDVLKVDEAEQSAVIRVRDAIYGGPEPCTVYLGRLEDVDWKFGHKPGR